ncbi:hypothetical protein [Paenarthrobacter nicotinovorans]|uniref:hypothetical protein n=1 Tax=Paenarthrobacter nicotinovorans TaxID=29320 RepID=UPI003D6710FE
MPKIISSADLAAAQKNLSSYALLEASNAASRLGFDWLPTTDAPNTFKLLKAAYETSMRTKQPLPVSAENSSRVVFADKEGNYAYRFVHDVGHVEMGLGFNSPDEFELARRLMCRLERAGYGPDTLEWQLYQADAIGQVMHYAITKRYVGDQLQFALDCAAHGLDCGIFLEIERQRG